MAAVVTSSRAMTGALVTFDCQISGCSYYMYYNARSCDLHRSHVRALVTAVHLDFQTSRCNYCLCIVITILLSCIKVVLLVNIPRNS